MNVILYTTHCPKCTILSKKLQDVNITFEECTDTNVMRSKGFEWVPILEVDGRYMDYKKALDWANSVDGGQELGKIQ